MVAPAIDKAELKQALKAALVEVLDERSDLLRQMVVEVIEDISLVRAIEDGEVTEPVSRAEVFQILDRTG